MSIYPKPNKAISYTYLRCELVMVIFVLSRIVHGLSGITRAYDVFGILMLVDLVLLIGFLFYRYERFFL